MGSSLTRLSLLVISHLSPELDPRQAAAVAPESAKNPVQKRWSNRAERSVSFLGSRIHSRCTLIQEGDYGRQGALEIVLWA